MADCRQYDPRVLLDRNRARHRAALPLALVSRGAARGRRRRRPGRGSRRAGRSPSSSSRRSPRGRTPTAAPSASSCPAPARRSPASGRSPRSSAGVSSRRSSISTGTSSIQLADAARRDDDLRRPAAAGLAPQRRAVSRRDRRAGLPRPAHVAARPGSTGSSRSPTSRRPRWRSQPGRNRRSEPVRTPTRRRRSHGSTCGSPGPTTRERERRSCSSAGSSSSPRSASSPASPIAGRAAVLVAPVALATALVLRAVGVDDPTTVVVALVVATGAGSLLLALREELLVPAVVCFLAAFLVTLAVWPEVNALAAIGPHPDGGGRFYGVTNQVETLLLAPSLAAAAAAGVAGAADDRVAPARDRRLEPGRGRRGRRHRRRLGVRRAPRRAHPDPADAGPDRRRRTRRRRSRSRGRRCRRAPRRLEPRHRRGRRWPRHAVRRSRPAPQDLVGGRDVGDAHGVSLPPLARRPRLARREGTTTAR